MGSFIGVEKSAPFSYQTDVSEKRVYSHSIKGIKKDEKMCGQDVHQEVILNYRGTQVLFMAVYDGHGEKGREVAEETRDMVDEYFKDNYKELVRIKTRAAVSRFFTEMFKRIQSSYKAREIYDLSGTCCVSILIIDEKMFFINLGDSRGVIGANNAGDIVCIQMTEDHKPSLNEEKLRITKCGGEVKTFNSISRISKSIKVKSWASCFEDFRRFIRS